MYHSKIIGTGLYAPEKVVENAYFNSLYGKDVSTFLKESRHIYRRHFMSSDQATSDLIVEASKEAISDAGLSKEDLDLIIVSTDTPDYISPATATVVQHKLSAKQAAAFDINSACAGFVTALDLATKYIASDKQYKNILVAGGYGMSKYLDFDDYKIATLFADGAGAVIVQRTEQPGVLASELRTDGQYHDYMGIYAGGTYQPYSPEAVEKRQHLLKFVKKIPTETNSIVWPQLIHSLLDRTKNTLSDVKHFFLTQINIQSIHETLDKLSLPRSLAHNIMQEYGYTGSACIPMALADASRSGKLHKGDLVVLVGSGGGMSVAGLVMVW